LKHLPGQGDESHHRAEERNRLTEIEESELTRIAQWSKVECEPALFRLRVLSGWIRRQMCEPLGILLAHGFATECS